jgi:hypothetical protein
LWVVMSLIEGFVLNLCIWKHISKFIAHHSGEEYFSWNYALEKVCFGGTYFLLLELDLCLSPFLYALVAIKVRRHSSLQQA